MELDYSIHGYPGHRGNPHFSTYISIICIKAPYTWSEIYAVLYALLKWDLSVPFFVLFIQISFLSVLHYLVLLVHRIQATSVFLEHWLDIHLTRTLLHPQCTSSYQWNQFYRCTTNSNMVENIRSHLLTFTDSSGELGNCDITYKSTRPSQAAEKQDSACSNLVFHSNRIPSIYLLPPFFITAASSRVSWRSPSAVSLLCGSHLPGTLACIRDSFIYFKQHRRET